jgi:hypothetical protein
MAYKGTLTGGTTVRREGSAVSKCTVYDVSHMGVSCSSELSLVALPQLYTELYARVKGAYTCLAVPDFDPAVCLGELYMHYCAIIFSSNHLYTWYKINSLHTSELVS